jgi:hypothetical protein
LFRNDLTVRAGRLPAPALHRRHQRKPHRPALVRMGRRGGDFDNTADVDIYRTGSRAVRCCATTATARSATRRSGREPRPTDSGGYRRRSSTTTATAGSICSVGNY